MKLIKLFMSTTVALVLTLTCTSVMAEWRSFGESSSNATNYIDIDSLERAGDKATLWKLKSYKKAGLEYGQSSIFNQTDEEYQVLPEVKDGSPAIAQIKPEIDLSGRDIAYEAIPTDGPFVDPQGSLTGALLRNTTPFGALMSSQPHREINADLLNGFNFIDHLKPDMFPYAARFALDSSEEEMLETEKRVRKELQDKALIAQYPFKSLLISLILNSPFLALAVIFIRSLARKRTDKE